MVSGSLTESPGTGKERAAVAMNSTENTKAHTQSTVGSPGHTVQKSQLEHLKVGSDLELEPLQDNAERAAYVGLDRDLPRHYFRLTRLCSFVCFFLF